MCFEFWAHFYLVGLNMKTAKTTLFQNTYGILLLRLKSSLCLSTLGKDPVCVMCLCTLQTMCSFASFSGHSC